MRRRRVLFLTYHLPLPEEPGAFRPWMEARLMVKAGLDVVAVTSGVQYMTGEDIRKSRGWCTEEKLEGVRILRVWAPKHHRDSIFKRILNYLSYATLAGVASILKVGKVDCVFAGTDPIFMMPVVFLTAKLKRACLVLDERDLYPETAIALGVVREGLLTDLLFRMQGFFRKCSAGILTATPGIRERLISYGCPQEKVHLLYNADIFLEETSPELDIYTDLRVELGKRFLVGYTGGLGRCNDIFTLIRSSEHLRDLQDICIVIVGSGEMLGEYKRYAEERKLENVHFLPAVPRAVVRHLQRQFDLCVQCLPQGQYFTSALNSKTFDYLGLGKPIVFAGSGDTEELLKVSGAGISVPPGDDTSLARAIRTLYENPSLREQMGRNARRWFRENITVASGLEIIKKAMKVNGES